MYVESKADSLNGPAWIGSVFFSKRGATLYDKGRSFRSLKGRGFKANYYDTETLDQYWISGPRKDGKDRLYNTGPPCTSTSTYGMSIGRRYARRRPFQNAANNALRGLENHQHQDSDDENRQKRRPDVAADGEPFCGCARDSVTFDSRDLRAQRRRVAEIRREYCHRP